MMATLIAGGSFDSAAADGSLERIGTAKERGDGLEEDRQIQAKRPMADVVKIVLDALPELVDRVGLTTPTVDLGPTGDARLDAEPRCVLLDRIVIQQVPSFRARGMRPRPDEGHVAPDHVEELREF